MDLNLDSSYLVVCGRAAQPLEARFTAERIERVPRSLPRWRVIALQGRTQERKHGVYFQCGVACGVATSNTASCRGWRYTSWVWRRGEGSVRFP